MTSLWHDCRLRVAFKFARVETLRCPHLSPQVCSGRNVVPPVVDS